MPVAIRIAAANIHPSIPKAVSRKSIIKRYMLKHDYPSLELPFSFYKTH